MAMSRPLLNADDGGGIFECPVCLLSMTGRRTRALPCLHTFCETCLVECVQNNQPGKITCPTCRKVTQLPSGGVTELPHNFQLDKFSALLHQEHFCQICIETLQSPPVATCFCGNCQKKYCDSCKEKHRSIPVFSEHHLFPIADYTRTENTNVCDLHGMVVELYCLECQECLCSSCAMKPKHNGHYDKLVNMRKEIDTCTQEAADVTKQIKQRIPTWSDSLTDTMTRLNKLNTSIEGERNKRVQRINAEAERLKEELKKKHIQPVQECMTCLEELKKSTEATDNLIQRKHFTPNTITCLKKLTSGCKENKRSLENKMKNLQEVPEFDVSSELSNFGSLSIKARSEGLSFPTARLDDSTLSNMQTHRDKRPSEEERDALMTRGTRVKIGPDWNSGWKPSGEGTVVKHSIWGKHMVVVKWHGEGKQTVCRVGAEGCFDIRLV